MLKRLKVENLAVVESIEAEFDEGLNVITGETGAGKSVIISAIELVLGCRADASVVRDGAKEARVEAEFRVDDLRIDALLGELGIDGGETLIIRRIVSKSSGGRMWVNDCATTVATLRKLGVLLADIHGPRANQNILEESFQRSVLDSSGSIEREKYACVWRDLADTRAEMESLRTDMERGAGSGEEDLLAFQVAELEEAAISSEDDDLAERQKAAAHAEEIVDAANAATDALGGDEGVCALVAQVNLRLARIGKFFPEAEEWRARADEISLAAEDLSRSIADAASRLDIEPGELARMDARLSVVSRIARKYHLAEDGEVSRHAAELLEMKRARLAFLAGREEKLKELAAREDEQLAKVKAEGAKLKNARAKAGEKIAKDVTKALRSLGFAAARFAVEVCEAEPTASGADRVEFIFEPNPGESARPLADIASSGEAARVMLAIKSILAECDGTSTLVFDEIDANIGGETGRAVGETMRKTARHHQVMAITHLAQSAVFAERHLVVAKSVRDGRTRTGISAVDGAAREKEIARMLGGGDAALEHAKALLAHTGRTIK